MDPMEIDSTPSTAPKSPAQQRNAARLPVNPDRPSINKRVSFDVPPRTDDPKKQRKSPPPPQIQPADTTTLPATPASPDSSSLSLLPSIFRPFHSVPKPSSKPLTREDILVQTIDELAGQKEDTKRFQIHLATKERDRILSTERTRIRAAKEKGDKESSQDVTQEELDAIRSRLAARPDPKKQNRDFEYRGGEWIRDPEEREKWKRAKGDELGHGVAEKLLALTAEAAAKMKVHEVQINVVIEGKKRVLESERRRIAALEARTEE